MNTQPWHPPFELDPGPLDPDDIRELALHLCADLATLAGEPEAIRAELDAWLDHYGALATVFTAYAALAITYSECLTIPSTHAEPPVPFQPLDLTHADTSPQKG